MLPRNRRDGVRQGCQKGNMPLSRRSGKCRASVADCSFEPLPLCFNGVHAGHPISCGCFIPSVRKVTPRTMLQACIRANGSSSLLLTDAACRCPVSPRKVHSWRLKILTYAKLRQRVPKWFSAGLASCPLLDYCWTLGQYVQRGWPQPDLFMVRVLLTHCAVHDNWDTH